MIRLHIVLTLSFLLVTLAHCKAQDDVVYEIPFSIEKRLLVFKGKLNGVDTDFAFDTGAAEGIATTKNEVNKGVERQKSSQRISDSSGKRDFLQSVITKRLSIGGYMFNDIRATISDMQYLYCMDLYLLGADVIRNLNWEIDFKKMVLRISKNAFETNERMAIIPVKYKYNTPRIEVILNEMKFDNVLIDFGFTGIMNIPNTDKRIKDFLKKKQQEHVVTSKISSNFAALGMSKPSLTETIVIDSLFINKYCYRQIPADFLTNTSSMIGLNFFSSIADKVIINNSQKKYYLQLKEKNEFKNSFPVSVLLRDGKLKIVSAAVSDNVIGNTFAIDEEIKSINEKTATDFKSECDFLTWYYTKKGDTQTIEKMNGEKIKVEKIPNR